MLQAEKKQGSAEAHAVWQDAQQDYNAAAMSFQRSRNLPGAIFASSNAALISAQLGNDTAALRVCSRLSVLHAGIPLPVCMPRIAMAANVYSVPSARGVGQDSKSRSLEDSTQTQCTCRPQQRMSHIRDPALTSPPASTHVLEAPPR